ncbi:MAG TPA: hypothetical protein VGD47_02850 [Steroidobacteraceae bacterium]
MLKTVVIGACLVLPLAACTTAPPTRELAKMPSFASAPLIGCVPDTASRLPVTRDCGGFGQSYTREQLQRTGAHDTVEALRLLDPSLIVRGR